MPALTSRLLYMVYDIVLVQYDIMRERNVIDPEAVLESFRISESGPAHAGPDPTSPTTPRSTHGQCMTMIRIFGP